MAEAPPVHWSRYRRFALPESAQFADTTAVNVQGPRINGTGGRRR
jgi:hypothetical protein